MAKKKTKTKTGKIQDYNSKKKKKKKTKSKGSIGKWGSITFSVSPKKQKTFTGLSWTTSIQFETKQRKKKVSKVTFKGVDPDTFSFAMRLSVFGGLNPLNEIKKLDKLARKGQANRLIIGGKKYGSNKTVITGITKNLKYFDNKGNLWVAEAKISMKEKG